MQTAELLFALMKTRFGHENDEWRIVFFVRLLLS